MIRRTVPPFLFPETSNSFQLAISSSFSKMVRTMFSKLNYVLIYLITSNIAEGEIQKSFLAFSTIFRKLSGKFRVVGNQSETTKTKSGWYPDVSRDSCKCFQQSLNVTEPVPYVFQLVSGNFQLVSGNFQLQLRLLLWSRSLHFIQVV